MVAENAVTDRTLFKSRGGFFVTGSTNTNMTGALDRGMLVTGDGLVGISTGLPGAALDVVSTGTTMNQHALIFRASYSTKFSSMKVTGVLYPQVGASVPPSISVSTINATATTQYGGINVTTNAFISGNLSIGTTVQAAPLYIYSPTNIGNAMIISTGSAATQQIMRVSTMGVLYAAGGVTYGADLAEMYPVGSGVMKGDVVMLDAGRAVGGVPALKKASSGKGRLFGVISSDPGMVIGWKDMSKDNLSGYAPVALSGRVPVRVCSEGGHISVGDYLSLSSRPGYARKAAGGEDTIGIALGASSKDEELILGFVLLGDGSLAAEVRALKEFNARLGTEIKELRGLITGRASEK